MTDQKWSLFCLLHSYISSCWIAYTMESVSAYSRLYVLAKFLWMAFCSESPSGTTYQGLIRSCLHIRAWIRFPFFNTCLSCVARRKNKKRETLTCNLLNRLMVFSQSVVSLSSIRPLTLPMVLPNTELCISLINLVNAFIAFVRLSVLKSIYSLSQSDW